MFEVSVERGVVEETVAVHELETAFVAEVEWNTECVIPRLLRRVNAGTIGEDRLKIFLHNTIIAFTFAVFA